MLVIIVDIRTLGATTEQRALVANLVLAASVVFVFCSTIALGVVLNVQS